ncbi:TolC family protein [Granulicella tundricola]|uniref:Outer membrane efflux protein n=1 Tax=Granulicella tundricola (strain ATCC BAA-1859 / DSM 23138 / MP5ACTX9) TaxID=1198114 RepID=E8X6N2_GRATM|nr:TolC family protein [Granulicella tundricola]ADW71182.1 outer membrane efflux protein [Granulicella tundricola MP5ACTX9]
MFGTRARTLVIQVSLMFFNVFLLWGQAPVRLQASPLAQATLTPSDVVLTLAQVEDQAIKNQPRIQAAQLRAKAYQERIRESRAGLLPVLAFNATGVLVADTGTSTAAGNITTSAISNRFAYGGNLTQLVTDFGRTSALVSSAKRTAEAQGEFATLTRAQIRLNVRDAYYQVLGAEAVLKAAHEAQGNRALISRQVGALAQSQLRSTLDVNFAGVLESEAELAVVQAESIVHQRRDQLTTAMGDQHSVIAALAEEPLPAALPPDPEGLLGQAQQDRADLNTLRLEQKAADQFAKAERKLSYPSLNVLGSAGELPFHDHTLHDSYAAAGFNLNIPILNGGLFSARRSEAQLEASARSRDVEETKLEVTQQVRDAWYQANESFRSLAVTSRLVSQSREALHLAQARYDSGLGSIVELNEAQLNEFSAEISAAGAKYTYLSRRATLDFATGLLN